MSEANRDAYCCVGGITNGNDLVAAYARLSGRWDQSVVQMGLAFTEVEDRGQFYPDAKAE